MAKQGMKRPERTHTKKKNETKPVPEIQHSKNSTTDRPIPSVYPVIDTDAARDNIENDMSFADLEDL